MDTDVVSVGSTNQGHQHGLWLQCGGDLIQKTSHSSVRCLSQGDHVLACVLSPGAEAGQAAATAHHPALGLTVLCAAQGIAMAVLSSLSWPPED